MASRTAAETMRIERERQAERGRGAPITGGAGLRLSSARVAETQIAHVGKLPCVRSNETLQNEAGEFLYLEGYSAAGGGDIGAPPLDED